MTASHPIFLYSFLDVHWGYIIRQPGATAAQAAYIVPPPTTIIGAFGNPLARLLGVGDYVERRKKKGLPVQNRYMECLIASTLAAGAGLLSLEGASVGAVTYEEPSRIMGTPYKGGGSYKAAVKKPIYESATELLPVQALGVASAPGARLVISWLLDLDRLRRCLNAFVGAEHLEAAAWGVYRVGSREGLVNVVSAGATEDVDVVEAGFYSSFLYQDSSCALVRRGPVSVIVVPGLNYKEREFLAPTGMLGGLNILTPPQGPARFYLSRPECKAAGATVSLGGREYPLYLAYMG